MAAGGEGEKAGIRFPGNILTEVRRTRVAYFGTWPCPRAPSARVHLPQSTRRSATAKLVGETYQRDRDREKEREKEKIEYATEFDVALRDAGHADLVEGACQEASERGDERDRPFARHNEKQRSAAHKTRSWAVKVDEVQVEESQPRKTTKRTAEKRREHNHLPRAAHPVATDTIVCSAMKHSMNRSGNSFMNVIENLTRDQQKTPSRQGAAEIYGERERKREKSTWSS